MSRNSPLDHANLNWRSWLKSVVAARVLPDGQKELAQAQDLAPSLQATLQVEDLRHLTRPTNLARGLAGGTKIQAGNANPVGIELTAPAEGGGIWLLAFAAHREVVIQDQFNIAIDDVSRLTIDRNPLEVFDIGTKPTTVIPTQGQAVAILNAADFPQVQVHADAGSTPEWFYPRQLYIPAGKIFTYLSRANDDRFTAGVYIVWEECP